MTKEKKLISPLKWHGGKTYLAKRIIALMPPHQTYVEPYCGAAAVLIAKPTGWQASNLFECGVSEIINDLNGWLTDFWLVLQDKELFTRFHRRMEATPFSENEWRRARGERPRDPVDAAVALMVLHRQSRGGDPGKGHQTPSRRPRSGVNEHGSAWTGAIVGLPAVHQRLQRVHILNRPALDVIRQLDDREEKPDDVLFYLDPPYPHDTRASTDEYGSYEMTEADHVELLTTITEVKGKVILSCYRSTLYDERLSNWTRHDWGVPNNAAGGSKKKRMTESVWCNFA